MRDANLKGLATVKKTLASGTTVYYCYAWRGGPLLKDDKGEPIQPGDPLLDGAFKLAHEQRRAPSPTNLSTLITLYRGSSDFRRTKLGTRHEYDRYLDKIRMQFGGISLEELQQPPTRGSFKEWRDSLADTPRTADFAWMILVRVLSFAKDRGMISVNIAERGGRLYRSTRRDQTWADTDVAAFQAVAPPHMRLAIELAVDRTAQGRPSAALLARFRRHQSPLHSVENEGARFGAHGIPRRCPSLPEWQWHHPSKQSRRSLDKRWVQHLLEKVLREGWHH